MKKRWIALGFVLTLLLGCFAGCGESLPEVYVQSVSVLTGYGALGGVNASAGVVVSQNEIKVEKDEGRKIAELKVAAGQEVSEGDVLFTYDMEDMQLNLDKAELELEQMRNTVTDLDAQIAALEKEKQYAASSEQLSYTVQIQSLQTNKKETEYNITVKERELETMKRSVGDGNVTAPVAGKVQSVNENGGTDNMGNPLPYITIVQSGAYRIKGKINELNRNDISVGMAVTIRSRADETQLWSGTITEIDTENPDRGNDGFYYGVSDDTTSSSNYPFYIELDDTQGLMLGQHVYIEPANASDDGVMRLDASFLQGSAEEGFWVWAEAGKKLEKRAVTVGAYDEMTATYEIMDGLSPEDYIAFPEADVQEGAPTTHTKPVADSADDGFVDSDQAIIPETAGSATEGVTNAG